MNHVVKSEATFAAALAAMPLLGPHRLRKLLSCHVPSESWAVLRGDHSAHPSVEALFSREFPDYKLRDKLREGATDAHLQATHEQCIKSDMQVTFIGDSEYPEILAVDIAPPAVLFWCGDLGAITQRRVGVIGTRAATAAGRYMASQIAHDLTGQGVSVVSGLARGIDAWAHRGAMTAALHARSMSTTFGRPIAVVASGLDVVYPRENTQLWDEVRRHGVVLSESPPGTPPEAFRFPLRNRILAALCEVLVVVESRVAGGSMITVEEAQKRDVMVMAVPGSPRNSSSAGTNLLLQQGCAPVVEVADVLVALGLDHRRCFPNTFDPRRRPSAGDQVVLDAFGNGAFGNGAFGNGPNTLDQLMVGTKGDLITTALALGRLEADGWVVNNSGWWEAVGPSRA